MAPIGIGVGIEVILGGPRPRLGGTGALLEHLASGRTTIAIAHRLSTAARADRVLVLDHGRLVQDGSHTDLVQRDGAYARMYEAWVAATSAG